MQLFLVCCYEVAREILGCCGVVARVLLFSC